MLTDLRELVPVPADRSMPDGHLARRKELLLQSVDAELRTPARRFAVLRSVRLWLTTLGLVVVLLACATSAAGRATASAPTTTRAAVGVTVALAAAPGVVSLFATAGAVPLRRQAAA